MTSPWRALLIGAVIGSAAMASCSGVLGSRATPVDLAASPCGGTGLVELDSVTVSAVRSLFPNWPTPPVYASETPLADGAVGCFDGRVVVVVAEHRDDPSIIAHEFCHAIAHLDDSPVPGEFPVPSRPPQATTMSPELWAQEMWATTCSSAVTMTDDWSWGGIVSHADAATRNWSASYVQRGPTDAVTTPEGWYSGSEP